MLVDDRRSRWPQVSGRVADGPECRPSGGRGGAKASNVDAIGGRRHRRASWMSAPSLRSAHRTGAGGLCAGGILAASHYRSVRYVARSFQFFLERWSGSISGVEARSYRPRSGMIPRPRTSAIAATLALEDRLPDLVRVGIGNGFIKDAGPIPAVVSCDTFLVGNQ